MDKTYSTLKLFFTSAFVALMAQHAIAISNEIQALRNGDVITKLEKVTGSNFDQAISKGVIKAPIEKVWAALVDFGHYNEFIPNVVESRILQERQATVSYYSKVNMPWPISDIEYQCKATLYKEENRFTFELVPGTGVGVKDFHGSWVLTEFQNDPAQTLATYTLYYEPAKSYPTWVVRLGSKHTIEKNINAIRKRIKSIESTTKK